MTDGRLATIRIGKLAVALAVDAIGGFADAGFADADLGDVLGIPRDTSDRDAERHLLRLHHAGGDLVLAVPGTIRIDGDADADHAPIDRRCHRPSFVAGAFRRSCLRGVVRRGSELVYLVDVDAIAARTPPSAKEDSPCESV